MSSVSQFIKYPIETNPTTLAQRVYSYIQSRSPQWAPNDTALDTWIIQVITAILAEISDLASDVPADIFRWFGASMIGLPPLDEIPSTVSSTWTMINNAGHTISAGTQVGILDSTGTIVPFEVVTDLVVPPGSTATAAGAVLLRSQNPGADTAGLAGVGVALQLIDVLDFVSTVVATGQTTGGQDAELDADYLNRLATFLRLLSTRPILPNDFAILAREVAGVYRVVAIDGYNPFHNLLTLNQASAETDATGWANTGNATVASTSVQAADGAKSVSLTAIAGADMGAQTPPSAATGIPVTPGDTITGLVSIRANTTVRSCYAKLLFYDASNALIGNVAGAAANDSNAAWTVYTVTGVVPAAAAHATVEAHVVTPAAAELHYADKASIRRGSGVDWVPGGTGETGQPRMIAVASLDSSGANSSTPIKTQVQALLDASREVNFIVNTIDPTQNLIDVTYTAKALPGFDTAAVLAAINANLAAYLNALAWGTDPQGDPRDWRNNTVVRYSDIGAIISNTDGVDYWTALTTRIHAGTLAALDINLAGPAPVAILNTASGTVT